MLTKTNIKFFLKAKEAALLSDYQKIHVGCVAVYRGRVIAVGYNTNKTHPVQKYYNRFRKYTQNPDALLPKLHAEINCINDVKHFRINFTKAKLYIYRIRNDQDYGLARPCPSCMAAIRDIGIRDIYYTTDMGFAYERIENMRVD